MSRLTFNMFGSAHAKINSITFGRGMKFATGEAVEKLSEHEDKGELSELEKVVRCGECGCCGGSRDTVEDAEKAWNTRSDAWVRVEEMLPTKTDADSEGYVVVLREDETADFCRWNAVHNGCVTGRKYTHWKPLTAPPIQEGNK